MPLTVSGANVVIVIIAILWLLSGDYKLKYMQIISSKLMISSIIFYFCHLVAMLWTEDLMWGLHILHKMWYFILLFPILHSIVEREKIKHYITAFLLAIALTEIVSYLVWFEIIPPFKNATVENPTPFMSHISYNPILVFAIYIVLHKIFFKTNLSGIKFSLYSFFAITMTINMFITGGRAGQAAFFVMLSILILQFFNKEKIKSLLIVILIIPLIFFSAYKTSDIFNNRVNSAIEESINFSEYAEKRTEYTSVGLRISYAINSWEVIKENPIIGVGTGDFPLEYNKVNKSKTPHLLNQLGPTTNPHNMYTLVWVQLGIIGIISMLSIFYYQIKLSFSSTQRFYRDLGITLPIIFLVLMFSDSYLLGHFTTLVYVYFSAFLYKDFEKN